MTSSSVSVRCAGAGVRQDTGTPGPGARNPITATLTALPTEADNTMADDFDRAGETRAGLRMADAESPYR